MKLSAQRDVFGPDSEIMATIDCTLSMSYTWTVYDSSYKYEISFTVNPNLNREKLFRPLNLISLGETMSYSQFDLVRIAFSSRNVEYYCPLTVYAKVTGVGVKWIKEPLTDWYRVGKNGITAFNFTIPCENDGIWFQIQASSYVPDEFDVITDWKKVDCSFPTINTTTTSFMKEDGTPFVGKYDFAYDIVTDVSNGNQCTAQTFNPNSQVLGVSPKAKAPKFNKTVGLRTIVNKAGINDRISNSDDINVYIYSDVLNQMFKCGEFSVKTAGIIDFNDLQVPCSNYIIVTLLESDYLKNDGLTVRIPCFMEGKQTTDFVIKGGDIKRAQSFATEAINTFVG